LKRIAESIERELGVVEAELAVYAEKIAEIVRESEAAPYIVPAVYDVVPARIRACVARPGLAKCGWSGVWEA
ncbi:MAG: hypothetical protein LBD31_04425, partial [Treponema sp.]|nr:hypothetical protein [Treponema sp.]